HDEPTFSADSRDLRPFGRQAGQPARNRLAQDLQRPHRGTGRVPVRLQRRSGRPARPQRRRQDHQLLHDRGPGAGRRRPHRDRRLGHHRDADPQARPHGAVVPAAGRLGVPPPDGRAEHPRGAGTADRAGR
ncbi:hypothetical protein OY671_011799, partial [Metschnikowia pulcherrima]